MRARSPSLASRSDRASADQPYVIRPRLAWQILSFPRLPSTMRQRSREIFSSGKRFARQARPPSCPRSEDTDVHAPRERSNARTPEEGGRPREQSRPIRK
jgi:hypothetical protein